MDARSASPGRVKKAVEAGIFGYTEADGRYYQAVLNWFEKHYGWKAKADWIIKTPGVVFALAQAVKAYTAPGDGVLIQSPVYYPFYEVIRDNDRKIVENPLVLKDGHYEIDFEDLEKKIAEENIKLMFLCSPPQSSGKSVDERRAGKNWKDHPEISGDSGIR